MDPCCPLSPCHFARSRPFTHMIERSTTMATTFNSIRASRELETAGAAKPLADAIATIPGDTMVTSREDLVTKDSLKAELATVNIEIARVVTEIASEIGNAHPELADS